VSSKYRTAKVPKTIGLPKHLWDWLEQHTPADDSLSETVTKILIRACHDKICLIPTEELTHYVELERAVRDGKPTVECIERIDAFRKDN